MPTKKKVVIFMIDSKEYMDADNALSRIGGNVALYKKLLIYYLDDNHIDALSNAIDSGNVEDASRLAHTIKGVCANLSLNKLRAVAIKLEACIKEGQDCADLLLELRQTFEETSKVIEDYAC